ncbi:hypothetical protein F2P81_018562 [Scophthalmus maximus]|uniref:Coiled-coil domain-containing protein 3 n=1 Tax=Scophthalmus maximus TaxID=52904 RepID=A0A6A4S8K3_SCOMX|nr:hypothetical protein F2P81_018562 [Scophthalmus maximus]
MSGDRWVPVKVMNPSDKPVTLKRNTKLADVSPCVALEDLELNVDHTPATEIKAQGQSMQDCPIQATTGAHTHQDRLSNLGLGEIDINSCEVSLYWKGQLVDLIQHYEDVFSKDKLDCGCAKDFVHRIHLTDDCPFRLPYRRVPLGQYQKLREVLSEMEEKDIIRKPCSHFIDGNGVATDPDKVEAITAMTEGDLMMDDGVTPSAKKKFIQNCSSIAKPLFSLTTAAPGKTNARDASLDGLGAVISQVPEGECKARPIAFARPGGAQSVFHQHRLLSQTTYTPGSGVTTPSHIHYNDLRKRFEETSIGQTSLRSTIATAFRVFFSGFFGMCCTTLLLAALCAFAHLDTFTHGCQLPSEWRPLSEGCRAELAEIIVYARVLAIHREPPGGGEGSVHNSLAFGYGYGYEGAEEGLLYSAEVELLCDQAWGSMLEVPTGSRLNLTGLGYLSCQSHTVMENYSYFFFLRMDENYNFLPHGVNFQDAIFSDTADNRRMFSSLFQFSNCTMGNQPFHTFSPERDTGRQGGSKGKQQRSTSLTGSSLKARQSSASIHIGMKSCAPADPGTGDKLLCSSVQSALFDEEERGRKLRERLAAVERRNRQLKERVRKAKRSLRNARKATRRAEQAAQELQEQLKAAERREGHHLNAITQEEPPPGRYASAALRQQVQL